MKHPDPAPSLAEVVERLRARNDQLLAYLQSDASAITRVANAPEMSIEDATERARKYWDALEGIRAPNEDATERARKFWDALEWLRAPKGNK